MLHYVKIRFVIFLAPTLSFDHHDEPRSPSLLRPGLAHFLAETNKLFECHIYTMGSRDYAKQIAEIIDPTVRMQQCLWSQQAPPISNYLILSFASSNRVVTLVIESYRETTAVTWILRMSNDFFQLTTQWYWIHETRWNTVVFAWD